MLFCSFNKSGRNPLLELLLAVAESVMQASLGGLKKGPSCSCDRDECDRNLSLAVVAAKIGFGKRVNYLSTITRAVQK